MSTTLQATTAERLPRGPHSLSRAQVVQHQRERMLAAVVGAVAARGYGSITIGDITRRAHVSRDTFYQQFANKEECFLAAYDAITRALLDEMMAVGTSQATYVEAMRDGVRAYLRFFSERPEAARVCTLDILAAGEQALVHRERRIKNFARLFQATAERAATEQPGLPTIPAIVPRATVVLALELTTEYVRQDRVSALPELEDDILYLWLMCLAGHEVAAAALATRAVTTAGKARRPRAGRHS
jgi:AcrR family transcriptional regulator